MFSSRREADRVRVFLSPLRDPTAQEGRAYGFLLPKGSAGNCWFTWASSCKLELRYATEEREANSVVAKTTARELAKRFDCQRFGSKRGWWEDDERWGSHWVHSLSSVYGHHESWVDWIKNWNLDWFRKVMVLNQELEGYLDSEDRKEYEEMREAMLAKLRPVEAKVTARFARLDHGRGGNP